jgi:glycosyltransferase involved in cell wall biosynthesis
MNILHINQSDTWGGAAIAGYRLHQGLLDQGISSQLLVGKKETDDPLVFETPRSTRLDEQIEPFTRHLGLNYLHLLSSAKISQSEAYQTADLINFHNLHTGYFNYLTIPDLTAPKPAVLTLHDMWSFTGHCSYSYDCDRWQTGCGKCPYPETYPAIRRDNTALEWKLKNWVYRRSNLTIVAPSRWLTEQTQKSMLNRFPIHYIPNGIDTNTYQPLDRRTCRAALGISPQQHVLLFAADSLTEKRKGGDLLFNALQALPDALKAETVLLTFGGGCKSIAQTLGIPIHNLGFIGGDRLKAIAYSAADLFVLPTRADNLPLVLQESMACGTPMVSFNIGGVPDLVRPGVTGYLANPEDADDLSSGIVKLLDNQNERDRLGRNCREITLSEYTLELQATRYIQLYQKISNCPVL